MSELPAEIWCIIANFLVHRKRDYNALMCTCRLLNNALCSQLWAHKCRFSATISAINAIDYYIVRKNCLRHGPGCYCSMVVAVRDKSLIMNGYGVFFENPQFVYVYRRTSTGYTYKKSTNAPGISTTCTRYHDLKIE